MAIYIILSNYIISYTYIELLEMEVTNILELSYLQTKIIPEIAVKWYEISLELNIPVGKMEAIKNERDHCGAWCFEMLQT